MMRISLPLSVFALLVGAVPVHAADSLGIFGGWASFRDGREQRCYAIAEPQRGTAGGTEAAYASIGHWPERGVRGQLYLRLSRLQAKDSRVYLSIGERRFALMSGRGQAWAQDKAMDRTILSAMREAATMSVEGKAVNGRSFYDLYVLKGAATAMDAAALGCARILNQ